MDCCWSGTRMKWHASAWGVDLAAVSSKDDVEISREPPATMPEKISKRRVGHIGMNRFRIQVIRKIEPAHRHADRILRVYLKIAIDARIGG